VSFVSDKKIKRNGVKKTTATKHYKISLYFNHIQVFLSELHIFQRPFDIGLPTNYISFISSVCHLFIIIVANRRVAYSSLFPSEVHELIFLRQPLAEVPLSH
jgi:hypothetical protein